MLRACRREEATGLILRQEATKGDDAALAVLRSRQEEVAPETLQFVHERQQARSAYLASKTAVLEKTGPFSQSKKPSCQHGTDGQPGQ